MTNYNDRKWHGWNGGECPVHPKTRVEVCGIEWFDTEDATDFDWHESAEPPIVAFRVTKEYKEPRVLWVLIEDLGQHRYSNFDRTRVEKFQEDYQISGTIVKFVEGIEDENHYPR